METVSGDKKTTTMVYATTVVPRISQTSREPLGIKLVMLMFSISIMERHCYQGFGQIMRIRRMISLQYTLLLRILFGARMIQYVIKRTPNVEKRNNVNRSNMKRCFHHHILKNNRLIIAQRKKSKTSLYNFSSLCTFAVKKKLAIPYKTEKAWSNPQQSSIS